MLKTSSLILKKTVVEVAACTAGFCGSMFIYGFVKGFFHRSLTSK